MRGRQTSLAVLMLFVAPAIGGGCGRKGTASRPPAIAVANSYLYSAVRDLCGEAQDVFCMAAPGMCPGHFDLSPEQLNRLLQSKAFLRFDFQSGIDVKLARLKVPVLSVEARPGLCTPGVYLATCAEVLAFLETAASLDAGAGRDRLSDLRKRLDRLSVEMKRAVENANLKGAKVLASRRQVDSARWLGLDVVGIFQAADVMTPSDLETCLRAGREHNVRLVIANLQEGTQLPEKIAQNLEARLVVFSNFPDMNTFSHNAFEALLRSNLENLIQ